MSLEKCQLVHLDEVYQVRFKQGNGWAYTALLNRQARRY